MVKKEKKRPKLYRIVMIFSLLFLMFIEGYVFLISFRTVNVSSFDVEIAGNKIEINEDNKTFSVNDYSGSLIKTSKEYKEVLAVSWNNIAIIDNDNQLKIIDTDENILVLFNDFTLETEYLISKTLFEDQYIIKVNFIGNKKGKNFNIDYCYNKYNEKTYVIKNS